MPITGAKPKEDRSQIRHRNPAVVEWTEVDDVPFEDAPPLRDRATGGVSVLDVGAANSPDWPQATRDWWHDISRMPHCKLWTAAEWRFAMDTAEVHARTMEAWRGYTGTELRNREKQFGMLPDHRRDLRIRYVKPKADDDTENETPAGVVNMRDYRNL